MIHYVPILWIAGFFVTLLVIGAILDFFQKRAQNKATKIFQEMNSNLFAEIDTGVDDLNSIIADKSYGESVIAAILEKNCYFHTSKFPSSYGQCYCCERGELVRRLNSVNGVYFIGCTNYIAPLRFSRRGMYALKSCRFTFSIT